MDSLIKNIIEMMKIKSISGNLTEISMMFDLIEKLYVKDGVVAHRYNFENASPVMLLSNCDDLNFDVITIGHIDVVPAKDNMFNPRIEDNKIYGRGSLDMKASVAVCLETLLYTLGKNIKFGVLITSDEETSSGGMKALQKENKINAKIVLDTDSGDLTHLTEKYKHPVSISITAKGENAHSSQPWNGVNAVNNLISCINELEQMFPRFGKGNPPQNTWVDTMVVTAINSPATYNVVPAEAVSRVNFRLNETTSLEKLKSILETVTVKNNCSYEILLSSCGVYMNADNPYIKQYISVAEAVINSKIEISTSCGATDSRMFADKDAVIIMHSINGKDLHGDNEYAEIDSIFALRDIQKTFIDSLL